MIREAGHNLGAASQQLAQGRLVDLGPIPLVLLLGGRPDEHVTENGWRNQHALGALARHRQNHVRHQPRSRLVQDHELPLARPDGERRLTHDALDAIAVDAGGVDDHRGAALAATGLEPPLPMDEFTTADLAGTFEHGPVRHGLRRVGERRGPRIHHVLTGYDQSGAGAAANGRQAAIERVGVENRQVVDAVFRGLCAQHGQT